MRKWYWSLMLAVPVAVLTGCAGDAAGVRKGDWFKQKDMQDQQGDPVTLRIYDKNARSSFDDEIARTIMERTGVHIEVEDTTDNPDEKVAMMLAYRDYPDIILISLEDIDKYRESGALLDISGYVNREGSNVKEMYGDTLKRIQEKDGAVYYLTNWYGEDRDAVSAFQIRYDYLTELVGKERADSDIPFTQEEFLNLLRSFREKYPLIGGLDSIPFTVNQQLQYDSGLRGMYGMKLYYEEKGQLYHLVRHPHYLDMMNFMNIMYREGLMDKAWIVSNEMLFQENVLSGRVFATSCAYWDIAELNAALQEKYGEDAIMLGYKVLGEGIKEEETTYGGRNTLGWDAIAITDHCQDVEAAVRLIEFLASEEGQYLMLWGIEGKDWVYEDGVHVPTPETMEMLTGEKDWNSSPIRNWTWFIKNGYGSDTTPYDLKERYLPGRAAQVSNRNMKYDYWDMAPYSGLAPERDSREALQWKNIQDIMEREYPRIVNAPSEEEMRQLYGNLLESLETEGLSEVEAVLTRKYQDRLKQWGEEKEQ